MGKQAGVNRQVKRMTHTMTDTRTEQRRVKEAFSAWYDNEATELDMKVLTQALEKGIVSADMLAPLAMASGTFPDLTSAISEQVTEFEQTQKVTPKAVIPYSASPAWKPWVAAASVATFVLWASFTVNDPAAMLRQALINQAVQPVTNPGWDAGAQERLNQYLQQHLRQASLTSGKISLSYSQELTGS